MAINWKDILGDAYTEDLEKAINTAVGKDFVSKADFNAKVKQIGEHEKTIQSQTTELDNLRQTNVDAAAMQKQIDDLKVAHAAEIDQLVKRQIAYNEAMKAGAIDPEEKGEIDPEATEGIDADQTPEVTRDPNATPVPTYNGNVIKFEVPEGEGKNNTSSAGGVIMIVIIGLAALSVLSGIVEMIVKHFKNRDKNYKTD